MPETTSTPPRPRPCAAGPYTTIRRAVRRAPWPVLAVISAGGVTGALARYGLGQALPAQAGGFPWATFTVNVSGCLLMGALMVLATEVWPAQRLLRPFLGTGVLGGYTTFSTYIVETQHLLDHGAARTALAYVAGTAVTALAAVSFAAAAARLALRRGHPARSTR